MLCSDTAAERRANLLCTGTKKSIIQRRQWVQMDTRKIPAEALPIKGNSTAGGKSWHLSLGEVRLRWLDIARIVRYSSRLCGHSNWVLIICGLRDIGDAASAAAIESRGNISFTR